MKTPGKSKRKVDDKWDQDDEAGAVEIEICVLGDCVIVGERGSLSCFWDRRRILREHL